MHITCAVHAGNASSPSSSPLHACKHALTALTLAQYATHVHNRRANIVCKWANSCTEIQKNSPGVSRTNHTDSHKHLRPNDLWKHPCPGRPPTRACNELTFPPWNFSILGFSLVSVRGVKGPMASARRADASKASLYTPSHKIHTSVAPALVQCRARCGVTVGSHPTRRRE